MGVEQAVFWIAGAACILGAVTAVAHRDARTAGAALAFALVSVAVLYAALSAPALAGIALAVYLLVTLPLVVHHTVPVAPARSGEHIAGVGAAILAGALLGVLGLAVAYAEVPVNVSVRSADGYDVEALLDLLAGRFAVALGASAVVLAAAAIGTRSLRRAQGAR
jgi:NADH:ubiquinone oxidoreductase subunit 6 (subunit J)